MGDDVVANDDKMQEKSFTEDTEVYKKPCRGWSGEKYNSIWKESIKHHCDTLDMSKAAIQLMEFPLAPRYNDTKGYEELRFMQEGEGYVMRSVGCRHQFQSDGTARRLCNQCSLVSKYVGHLVQESKRVLGEITSDLRLTAKKRKMLPEEAVKLVDAVREKAKQDRRNEKREKRRDAARLASHLQLDGEKQD